MLFWSIKKQNLSEQLLILLLFSSTIFLSTLSAEPVSWREDAFDNMGMLSVPVNCGGSATMLTGVALDYLDDKKKDGFGSRDIFPITSQAAYDMKDLSSFDMDLSKGGSFAQTPVPSEGFTSKADIDFFDKSLKNVSAIESSGVVQASNIDSLARILARSRGKDFENISEKSQMAYLKAVHSALEQIDSRGLDYEVSFDVDCGEGGQHKVKLVSKLVTEFSLDQEGKLVQTQRDVLCKPEHAATDTSCLEAYKQALIDFKNSGKPMFAFSGSSGKGNGPGGSPDESTLSRHAGSASPASHERPYTSSPSESRGLKQAGPGGSHFRRN